MARRRPAADRRGQLVRHGRHELPRHRDRAAAFGRGDREGTPADRRRRRRRAARSPVVPWVLSAKSNQALRAQARQLLDHLAEHPGLDPADIGFSLATTRTAFRFGAACTGRDIESLTAGLEAIAAGRSAGVLSSPASGGAVACLFPGQGAQRIGMGRQLYQSSETSPRSFDAVCAELDPRLARPLREILWAEPGSPDAELLSQTHYTQPALFAVEVSLYRMFEAWGLRPSLLGGHSIGEVAAAHVAGILSLADAATLITARGRLMQELPAGGAMIALEASEDEVLPLLAGHADIGIAAINGPRAVVVSGDEATVEAVAAPDRRTRPQDQEARRQPRVPLPADGADAGRLPRSRPDA